MLGAGYYSPDLHLATTHFANGKIDEGRKMVMDHFARRRVQKSWDFIISDVDFCRDVMGNDYEAIFPKNSYLDLDVETTTFSSKKLSVGVVNRSDMILRNCTLILCINLTDMYSEDYHPITVGKTLPMMNANDTTDFGTCVLETDILGDIKEVASSHYGDSEYIAWMDNLSIEIEDSVKFR